MMRFVHILLILTLSFTSVYAQQFTDSVRVHFRVNQTVIDTLLMGNDQAMRGFAQRIKDLTSNDSLTTTINSILITGAASPEGSIAINKRLSEERAHTIAKWLHNYFDFPDSLPQFLFKGRDWKGLLMAVIGDPDVPDKREVISVIRDIIKTVNNNDGVESQQIRDGVNRLKAINYGVPYYYMWRNIFPSLRASEVFIDISRTPVRSLPHNLTTSQGGISNVTDTSGIDKSSLADSTNSETAKDLTKVSTTFAHNYGYCFAVKTNMLYDLALIPNIGIEFPVGHHFSIGADWMYAWWSDHDKNRHWRIYGGDVNARYYFGNSDGRPLTGHHIGIYGQVLVFQIAFGGKGYITGIPGENLWGKPYLGGGLEYGYSKQVSRRLNIDFSLGIGYMRGEYREYRPVDDHYVWQSSHRRNWIGPTKAEISLVWLIGKMQKGGIR